MKKKGIKRLLAFVLTLCMVVTGVFTADSGAMQVQAAEDTTEVYFYNSDNWDTVYAHAYAGG